MVVKLKYIPTLAGLVPTLVIGFVIERGVRGASHAIHPSHARRKSFRNQEMPLLREECGLRCSSKVSWYERYASVLKNTTRRFVVPASSQGFRELVES